MPFGYCSLRGLIRGMFTVRLGAKLWRKVFRFESRGSLLSRRGVHVEERPPMTIWIDKTVRVHEAEILRLVVGRAARGNRFGDKTIHLFTALAGKVKKYLNGLARIANGVGRELTKLIVRAQHNKNRIANNNASSIVTSDLGIAWEAECLVERHRLRQVSDREVDEYLLAHKFPLCH